MFKKFFKILALAALASHSYAKKIKIKEQCQMVNNILDNTDSSESCCFNERVICDSDMKNIIQLNLSNLGLKKIDVDVTRLPALVALDVSGNKDIKKIPKKIKNLTHLEILNISDLPKLTKLPDNITLLKNLNILILNNDVGIKQLPVNIGNLTKLNQLYAISSGLEIIPASIVNLKKLVIANFSGSKNLYGKIPELPDDVICDYSGTNICHYKNVNYPNKWIIPADIYCETVNISPVNMGKAITYNNDEDDDDDENVDYKCGKKYGVCPNGGCCSKYGYCGTTDAHCKIDRECQPDFGICIDVDENGKEVKVGVIVEPVSKVVTTTAPTTTPTTTTAAPLPTSDASVNYRCGKGYGVCGRGLCCSKFGWCGTSEDFCSANTCQKEFGVCWNTSSTPKVKNVPGRCGALYGTCPSGYCCSKYGWCGVTQSYCAANKCQPQYGMCSKTESKSNDNIIRDDGRCGEGYGKCAPGTCCSKYGWCGTEDIFCRVKSGCQPNYGYCKA